MTAATYQVNITAGSHAWVVRHTDPPAPTATTQVLDNLTIGWRYPEGKPWPCQPEPATLSLKLLATDADNLGDLRVGDPISVICTLTPGFPGTNRFAGFKGRLTDVDVDYVKNPTTGETNLRFTLTAVDHTADLAEVLIDASLPAQNLTQRLTSIAAAIAATGQAAAPLIAPAGLDEATYAPLELKARPALDVIVDHLDQLCLPEVGAFNYGEGWQRWHLVPNYSVGGSLISYSIAFFTDRVDSSYLPATLALDSGLVGLSYPDTFESLTADACDIPLDGVKWTRTKERAVNTVVVTHAAGTSVATRDTPPDPPVRLVLDFPDLTGNGQNQVWIPRMYLPDSSAEWIADGFTYDASGKLDAATTLGWGLDYDEDVYAALYAPAVIHGIPDALNLAGNSGIYAGQLQAVDITIAAGRILLDLALRRTLPRTLIDAADPAVATWAWATTAFPTTVWKGATPALDPDLTWYEARLIRRP